MFQVAESSQHQLQLPPPQRPQKSTAFNISVTPKKSSRFVLRDLTTRRPGKVRQLASLFEQTFASASKTYKVTPSRAGSRLSERAVRLTSANPLGSASVERRVRGLCEKLFDVSSSFHTSSMVESKSKSVGCEYVAKKEASVTSSPVRDADTGVPDTCSLS